MDTKPFTTEKCVCAIGVFDGVHRGHQALLEALINDASARGVKPVVVTFDRDPDELFCPEKVQKLLADDDRIGYLGQIVPDVLVLCFEPELAEQPWQDFLDYLVVKMPGLEAIFVGDNFRFGAAAAGGIPELISWGAQNNIAVAHQALYTHEGVPVSASYIRTLLGEGRITLATELLTRYFALTGMIVKGEQRGTDMGFATANVEVDGSFGQLGSFVYAAYGTLGEVRYKAAVSIGEPPTFSAESRVFNPYFFEAHLLDYEGADLYDQELKLEFVENLRPMKKFDDVQELIATVMGNINWVRENL